MKLEYDVIEDAFDDTTHIRTMTEQALSPGLWVDDPNHTLYASSYNSRCHFRPHDEKDGRNRFLIPSPDKRPNTGLG